MLGDDDDRHNDDNRGEPGAVGRMRKNYGSGREGDSGKDGGERDVFSEREDEDEDDESGECGGGRESEEDAEGGCDAFAAFEMKPDGVDVSEDGAERGERFSILERHGGETGTEDGSVGDAAGKPDGEEALAGIEDEGEDAELLCSGADNVGGPDVAAACGADVLFAEEPDEQESEGDGAKQIGSKTNQKIGKRGHRG